MTRINAFALEHSGLNEFLFADVGTELNGSTLTVLSILARLGSDPWAQAAEWAGSPKVAVIDRLAESIAQMPLVPSALAEARATAVRVALLLPSPTQTIPSKNDAGTGWSLVRGWMTWTMFYFLMTLMLQLSILSGPKPVTPIAAPVAPTVNLMH